MIELSGIIKEYPDGSSKLRVLKNIDLTIKQGEFVAIVGASGSGKSTLMNIIGIIDEPTFGQYHLLGRPVNVLSDDEKAALRSETIGFVFQQFHLLPRTSALDNVIMPTYYHFSKASDEHQRQKARQLLEKVGLGERLNHKPNQLSGGQQQRVAIARSLINDPSIILADEPTGNLDSKSSLEIMNLLAELNQSGITVIVITHEPEIAAYTNRIITFKDGEIISDQTKKKIKKEEAFYRSAKVENAALLPRLKVFFKQGVKMLLSNKARTFLSTLGIIIGVAAVIAVLAIGQGAQKSIQESLASLGSNMISVRPGSQSRGGVEQGATSRLTEIDANLIAQQSYVKYITPNVSSNARVAFKNKNTNTQLQGVSIEYEKMRTASPEAGRFFTKEEDQKRERVCLIGKTIVNKLFENENPLGQTLKINKTNFLVIGILPEKGASSFRDNDDLVLIPVQTAMKRLLGKLYFDSIDVEIISEDLTSYAETDILNLLKKRHKIPDDQEDSFRVRNMAEIQKAMSETAQTMALFLAMIAVISLLVGGIGIMNIMLVSVTERTREIGLRKAIGAKRFDILFQFVLEASLIGLAGGFGGLILALLSIFLVSVSTSWQVSISLYMLYLSIGFSLAIGILFGLWPARKASRLNPIDALRHE